MFNVKKEASSSSSTTAEGKARARSAAGGDNGSGGDNANDAASKSQPSAQVHMAPQLFPTLFDSLGGRAVTVTTDALLYALSNRLACDYEEARLVIEAAERVGIVLTQAPGLHRLQDVAVSPVDPPGSAP